jgi:hypothetical protein
MDTGAMPTIYNAESLRQLFPNFESELMKIDLDSLSGLRENPLILPWVEFIVTRDYAFPYEFIIGQDTGEMYRFQLLRPNATMLISE